MRNQTIGHLSRIAMTLTVMALAPQAIAQTPPTLPPDPAADALPRALPSQAPSIDGLETMKQSVRYCGGQTDRNARLACFDGISAQVDAQVGNRSHQDYAWGIQDGKDSNGRPYATIAMDAVASGSVRDAAGTDHGRITLTIRCRAGQVASYVTFDRKVAPDAARDAEVLLVHGPNPPVLERWEVSQNGSSVGRWRDQAAINNLLQ